MTAVGSANSKVRFSSAPSFPRQLNLTAEVHEYQFSNVLTSIKMKTLLFSAFILCTTSVGIAIKCPICGSPTSMKDCEKNEIERDCGDKFDRCLKLSAYRNETPYFFRKVCETKSNCALQSKTCNQSLTCESDCCDSDGCNSSLQDGTVPDRCNSSVIIAFLMVTYALVSKMYY